ncbi:hypothetical protein [Sanyastnella coralliicola]|uniref:hypothetical protein n=1 Tax=Sanyastnella coralliicola TaxID=3069118 RepID=UPI0027BA582B|nr:hypothetical protein [Longitalea sp. SCSIO 12813]
MHTMKAFITLSTLVSFLLISALGFSQTTWTGNGDGILWADPSNWDNGLPAAGNDATIPTGAMAFISSFLTVDYLITVDGSLILDGFMYFTSGGLDVQGNFEMYNAEIYLFEGTSINNNGTFFTQDGTFVILETATFYNSSFVTFNTGIINTGNIVNEGTIFSNASFNTDGVIDNFGTFENGASVTNDGVINQCGIWNGPDPTNNPFAFACPGCTDPTACNYEPEAISDDGSCILPDGCTDSGACNYDPAATCDDGSCDYISCADCCGIPFGDGTTCDGICGPCNDDTSCYGCTYAVATNYDPAVTFDDGSCEFEVCDVTVDNQAVYDEAFAAGVASVEGSCPSDFNNDGTVGTADLLAFLGTLGTTCSPE